MLGDISGLEKIYIVCGYTDMRKSIDGLCVSIPGSGHPQSAMGYRQNGG